MGRKPSQRKREKEASRASPGAHTPHPGHAAHWSGLHLAPGFEAKSNPGFDGKYNVAVLITGELRVASDGHLQSIKSSLKGSDCFIVSYQRYAYVGKGLCKDGLYVEQREVLDLNTTAVPSSAWQWYLLQRALVEWRDEILRYSTVVRYRVDLDIPVGFR
jgi:hypothetical protein